MNMKSPKLQFHPSMLKLAYSAKSNIAAVTICDADEVLVQKGHKVPSQPSDRIWTESEVSVGVGNGGFAVAHAPGCQAKFSYFRFLRSASNH